MWGVGKPEASQDKYTASPDITLNSISESFMAGGATLLIKRKKKLIED